MKDRAYSIITLKARNIWIISICPLVPHQHTATDAGDVITSKKDEDFFILDGFCHFCEINN